MIFQDGCIFCKIVKKEIPSKVIYEEENYISFLDIGPVNKGHALVLTKDHYANIYEIPDEKIAGLSKVIKKISLALKKAMKAEGINIVQNNEKGAGQLVDHIHFHIIPRFKNDGIKHWPQGKYENEQEMEHIMNKIKSCI